MLQAASSWIEASLHQCPGLTFSSHPSRVRRVHDADFTVIGPEFVVQVRALGLEFDDVAAPAVEALQHDFLPHSRHDEVAVIGLRRASHADDAKVPGFGQVSDRDGVPAYSPGPGSAPEPLEGCCIQQEARQRGFC